MDLLYPFSYIISLIGLVGWFFVQGHKKFSNPASAMFVLGFLVYLCALAFSSASTSYKLMVLFRDMLVLAVVSQIFFIFSKSKTLSIVLLIAAALTVYFSYFSVLNYTFPQLHTEHIDENGEFLIRVTEQDEALVSAITDKFDCTVTRAFTPQDFESTRLDDYYIINSATDSKRSWKRMLKYLQKRRGVDWIEPNEKLALVSPIEGVSSEIDHAFMVNDPGVRQQWGLLPMDVDALHRRLSNSGIQPRKVATIAILDSGIDAKHEDIIANYKSYKEQYDTDGNGHGTHCAGIAAAVSNNKKGIASYSPSEGYVKVSSFQVMNMFGVGNQHDIIRGIIEAVDAGADVISMSLGAPTQQEAEIAYQEAINYAADHGTIVVVSAGNSNENATTQTPANLDGVIVVSALGRNQRKSSFSNTVQDVKMGVAAPGVDIYSTLPNNKYAPKSGTSMSAPYVSGLIGLMKSFYPDLTVDEAYAILHKTGKKTRDGAKTGRLIQPLPAIEQLLD